MSNVVSIQTRLAWRVFRGPSWAWVAECPALKLVVQGETWGDMQASADEAVSLLLEDLLESNELDTFLRKHGWGTVLPLPAPNEAGVVRFDVPMIFKDADLNSTRAVAQ